MRREELELIERFVAAWNRRDLDALLSLADPEVEYVNAPGALEPGVRSGRAALSLVVEKQWEGLGAEARQAIDRSHEVGDDIVTIGRLSRTMPGSDTRIEVDIAARWSFHDGCVARFELLGAGTGFRDALESVGLSE